MKTETTDKYGFPRIEIVIGIPTEYADSFDLIGRQLSPSEINDYFRAQVDRELPKPVGGFETNEQEQDHRERQEARFMELMNAVAR